MEGKKLVMVIDDDAIIRIMMNKYFLDKGLEVVLYANPVEAIDFYDNNKDRVNFVVCDYMMPNMTGDNVFFELKKINPQIRYILVSGSKTDEIDSRFRREITFFLNKPINFNLLDKVVEALY